MDVCGKIVECRRSAPSPTDGEAGTSWMTESTESTVGAFDSKDSKDSKDLPGVTAVPTDTPQFLQAIGFRCSFFFWICLSSCYLGLQTREDPESSELL